jgi:hypothetical protein
MVMTNFALRLKHASTKVHQSLQIVRHPASPPAQDLGLYNHRSPQKAPGYWLASGCGGFRWFWLFFGYQALPVPFNGAKRLGYGGRLGHSTALARNQMHQKENSGLTPLLPVHSYTQANPGVLALSRALHNAKKLLDNYKVYVKSAPSP